MLNFFVLNLFVFRECCCYRVLSKRMYKHKMIQRVYPCAGTRNVETARSFRRFGMSRFRYDKIGTVVKFYLRYIFEPDIGFQKLFCLRRGKKATAWHKGASISGKIICDNILGIRFSTAIDNNAIIYNPRFINTQ